ncbi:hypothetical protein V1511DRAFT_455403 [Dipodascopsis uninucleata]
MVKLKEIPRTATFTWSPGPQLPLLATGTVAGAVDADFSSSSSLEIWDLDLIDKSNDRFQITSPKVSVNTDARFHDLIWGAISPQHPRGLIAGAQENGVLSLWDPEALMKDPTSGVVLRKEAHSGAAKTLDFNPVQSNLLASAGTKGEIFVWDLDKPNTPLVPTSNNSRLDEIESVAWNSSVSHILATAGNNGFTAIWDLKQKREMLHLYYPGSSGGGRRGVSCVVWHPDISTKLITASEDDNSPVILMWDLRNAHAPEKILTGHDKGVLSLSWCKKDSDLLLSAGKDNRTLLWNPQSGELLGEFPIATNWTFETRFYDRNPDLFASASFDGKISIQTLQSTRRNDPVVTAPKTEGNDFWNNVTSYVDQHQSTFSLKQPPKWMKRPVGASFGFGGKLVTFHVDKSQPNKSVVAVKKMIIEPATVQETEKFEEAIKSQDLVGIAEARKESAPTEKDKNDWKILCALYDKDPKKKIMEFLGYTKDELQEIVEKLGGLAVNGREAPIKDIDTETEPKVEADDDMFKGSEKQDNFLNEVTSQPLKSFAVDDVFSTGAFTIFDNDTSDLDKSIAQALIMGDFSTAVDICLKGDRLSDAFMLALSGDDACREKVQKAYFKLNASGPSYVRLLSSVVSNNLPDLVENADISNWKEIVVALCTFAKDDEFNGLMAKLGDRLNEARQSSFGDKASRYRQSAALCYIVGSKLESLISIWIEELTFEEQVQLKTSSPSSGLTPFAIHIKTLQDFIEKVTVFRNAVKYNDPAHKTGESDYSLGLLYEAYREYSNIVASQGFLELAQKYLYLLPSQYPMASLEQQRVSKASTKSKETVANTMIYQSATTYGTTTNASASMYTAYGPAQASTTGGVSARVTTPSVPAPSGYAPSSQNPYAPAQVAPASIQPATQGLDNSASRPYGHAYRSSLSIPAPPPVVSPPSMQDKQNSSTPLPPPPTSTQSNKTSTGWNDAPLLKSSNILRKSTPAASQPILSPFPNQSSYNPSIAYSNTATTPPTGPGISRPPTGSIAPPPINAKPPQSVSVSPVQSPPPSGRRASTITNSFAPQVEFVSLAPPTSGIASTHGGVQPILPPPTGASMPPQLLQSMAAATQPGINRYTVPPTQLAQPERATRPTNPYAPPANNSQSQMPSGSVSNSYAPMAPHQESMSNVPPPPLQSNSYAPPSATSQTAPAPPKTPVSIAPSVSPVPSILASAPTKYPPGDRSHITPEAMPIYEILSGELASVKQKIPATFSRQVQDAEKRLNILFDHLNNQELLSSETIKEMVILAKALQVKDYQTAHAVHINLVTTRTDECGHWMVGIKRLIDMSRA